MAPYQVFRTNGEPTHYGEIHTQPGFDIVQAGLLTALCMVLTNVLIMLLTLKWNKRKIPRIIGGVITMGIGFIIVFCIFGTWESATVHTRVQYTAFSGKEVTAFVGVHVGLLGVNVTLVGDPLVQWNETINYNEFLNWVWDQGRPGFGTQAGAMAHSLRHGQQRGLPKPILDIAEYFTIDGELIRWGRYYRLAGYYTFILLWTAFPIWVIGFYFMLVQVFAWAAICFGITGGAMLIGIIVWSGLRSVCPIPFKIPFEDATIQLSYSWAYGLVLLFAIISILWGAGIYALVRMKVLAPKIKQDRVVQEREKKVSSSNIEMTSQSPKPSQNNSPPQNNQPQQSMIQPRALAPNNNPQNVTKTVSFTAQPQAQTTTTPAPASSYSRGMIVQAKYSGDNKFYRARIDDIQGNQFLVSYLDFTGSQEWVHVSAVKLI